MKCPVCDATLNRSTYESHPVFRCPDCAGYLMEKRRIATIKSSRELSTEALEEEVSEQRQPDSAGGLRCPKCLGRKMTKTPVPMRQALDEPFSIDICRHCSVAWFDGGELARLQLGYEATAEAIDELDFQQRVASRSDEERAAFDRQVEDLAQHTSFLQRAVGDLWWLSLIVALLGFALAYWYWSANG